MFKPRNTRPIYLTHAPHAAQCDDSNQGGADRGGGKLGLIGCVATVPTVVAHNTMSHGMGCSIKLQGVILGVVPLTPGAAPLKHQAMVHKNVGYPSLYIIIYYPS